MLHEELPEDNYQILKFIVQLLTEVCQRSKLNPLQRLNVKGHSTVLGSYVRDINLASLLKKTCQGVVFVIIKGLF